MKLSLINVETQDNGVVSGYWIQNFIGNVESAIRAAKITEFVNGNKIIVAVVNEVADPCPMGKFFVSLTPLNNKA